MQLTDLYWLAGLLEGEGSFMKGPPSKPNAPYISLQMTDEDVVARAANLFQVGYQRTKNRKPGLWKASYMVQFRGSRAASLMRDLRPLMGVRRKSQIEARKVMSLRKLAQHFGANHETLRRRLASLTS